MDYSILSDHEINVKVGEHIGFAAKLMAVNKQTDYCNNPADAWPIIVANGIALLPYQHSTPAAYLTAFGLVSRFNANDKNVLRAAMIVFLMTQETPNVPANSTGSDLR